MAVSREGRALRTWSGTAYRGGPTFERLSMGCQWGTEEPSFLTTCKAMFRREITPDSWLFDRVFQVTIAQSTQTAARPASRYAQKRSAARHKTAQEFLSVEASNKLADKTAVATRYARLDRLMAIRPADVVVKFAGRRWCERGLRLATPLSGAHGSARSFTAMCP